MSRCSDLFGDYPASICQDCPIINPTGPESVSGSESDHVLRGGGWNSKVGECSSSYRIAGLNDDTYNDIGFRLVLSI